MKKQNEQRITRNTLIGDIVQDFPSIIGILLEEGVHCVGCGASYSETVEEGLAAHGKTKEEIEEVVKKLNSAIPEETGSDDILFVTSHAASKLKEILKKQKKGNRLRIKVIPGGCSGYQYSFEFDSAQGKEDTILELEGGDIIVDAESLKHLQGSKVDYVDSLQGAGFRISNPHAKKTCGCGQSFR